MPVVLCHAGTPPGVAGPFGSVGRTAMDSVSAPLATILEAYFLALADRSPESLANIFAGNTARFYDVAAN